MYFKLCVKRQDNLALLLCCNCFGHRAFELKKSYGREDQTRILEFLKSSLFRKVSESKKYCLKRLNCFCNICGCRPGETVCGLFFEGIIFICICPGLGPGELLHLPGTA